MAFSWEAFKKHLMLKLTSVFIKTDHRVKQYHSLYNTMFNFQVFPIGELHSVEKKIHTFIITNGRKDCLEKEELCKQKVNTEKMD